jgi:hypothetical protein
MSNTSNIYQKNKHFGNNNYDKNNSDSSTSTTNADNTVTNITECLTEDHEKCTGKYIDSITGNFAIICSCKCDLNKRKRSKEK